MKSFQIYLLILCILSLVQCKKIELPPPSESEPVFTFSAVIDGSPIELKAGIADYYMFTSFEKDSADVFTFIGTLRQQNCQDTCSETIRIEIRDIAPNSGNNANIEAALRLGSYSYFQPLMPDTTVIYRTYFTAHPFSTQSNDFSYQWTFEDSNDIVQAPNPTRDYGAIGTYAVTLRCTDGLGCQSSQTQSVHISPDPSSCSVDIMGSIVQNSELQLEAFPQLNTGAGGEIVWDNAADSSHIALPGASGQYCVQYLSFDQCESQACAGVHIDNDSIPNINYCTTSFGYELEIDTIIETPSSQLGTVIVFYTDKSGNTYRSDKVEQNTEAYFQITAVEGFEDNEKGEKTKKLGIELQTILMDEMGNRLEIIEGVGTIGVAYP